MRRAWAPAALLLLCACPATIRSNDPVARDQEIVRDILWRFQQDSRLTGLTAESRDAEVTVRGTVTTVEARDAAEKICYDTRSVRAVRVLVDVRPK